MLNSLIRTSHEISRVFFNHLIFFFFLKFLVYGLYRDRQQSGFHLHAIVCQVL